MKKLKTENCKLKTGNSGFTLVELLLAITLGAIVIMLISGIFAQTLRLQRRAFFIQRVQENLSLMLEAMAKEIRVSTISTPNTNCPSAPVQLLTINHPVNGNIEYSLSLSDNSVHRKLLDSGIDTVLNSTNVKVNRMNFCVSGNSLDDNLQPRVTISLTVQNANGTEIFPIDVQTTVSQRLLSD